MDCGDFRFARATSCSRVPQSRWAIEFEGGRGWAVDDENLKTSLGFVERVVGIYAVAFLSESPGSSSPRRWSLEERDFGAKRSRVLRARRRPGGVLLDDVIAESLVGIAVRFVSGCFVMADT